MALPARHRGADRTPAARRQRFVEPPQGQAVGSDPEIAREAVDALKAALPLTAPNIKVLVNKGWITLEGEVEWHYQRDTAERTVRRLRGVKGLSNLLKVKPSAPTPKSRAKRWMP